MSSSPSSGLSAEAKEFVPLIQTANNTIPFYVDENSVATIYSSDQPPFMLQTVYPMMIGNAKMLDISNGNPPFPEIEFHIQPSQQQQFHIDSCSNVGQNNSNSVSSTNGSQIVLLPTTNTGATAYYPQSQIVYSPQETPAGYYPIEYCEPGLINFSVSHGNVLNKTNRGSGRLPRPSSFRTQHGNHSSSYRLGNHHSNRNSYYDYHSRRNGGTTSYPSHLSRGNSSNSKRISSSYNQQDYNTYYHNTSTRSRAYAARSTQFHEDQRKDQSEYYNQGKDFYENDYQQTTDANDDETPFEFRPEDFPSLPINQQSDKTSPQPVPPSISRSASSWNAIVSATRPHSTSPHSAAQSLSQSQDQRSDRSRSFNNSKTASSNEKNQTNSTKKSSRSTTNKSKSPKSASKSTAHEDNRDSTMKQSRKTENDSTDDGFIQTKQQQRRLKRKNRMKEDLNFSNDEISFNNKSDQRSEQNSFDSKDKSRDFIEKVHQMDLNDRLSSSGGDPENEESDRKPSAIGSIKKDKTVENKFSIKSTIDNGLAQTDTNTDGPKENETNQNSSSLSSNSTNSSDTSDYDDAVDNLAEE